MKIFFSGIGGAGLSALAIMSTKLGYEVLGSDIVKTQMSKYLESLNIPITYSQDGSTLDSSIDIYLCSAAIREDNLEYIKAKDLKLNIQRREYLIDQLLKDKISIGICGTHGKTTTTSLLAHCLIEMKQDPSYLIGGILQSSGKNAELGQGEHFVWEADEYSNAFLGVHVNYSIFNNCEYDHPDFFKTKEDYYNSFKLFLSNNVKDKIIANFNDENVIDICKDINDSKERIISFSTSLNDELTDDEKLIDYCANSINFGTDNTQFIITHNNDHFFIMSKLHGMHNVYNVTAVFALLYSLGFDASSISSAISTFEGSNRRLETIYTNNFVQVISDYAHHPTAIKTTIDGVKSLNLPIIAVFEPHQYLRLKTLMPEFLRAFEQADEVLILPIYSAREKNVPEDFSKDFTNNLNHNNKHYIQSYSDLLNLIRRENTEKKVYLCMSAGPLDEYLRQNLN